MQNFLNIPPRNIWDYVGYTLWVSILSLWAFGIYVIIHFAIKFW